MSELSQIMKGGSSIDPETCLTEMSTIEHTLASATVEHLITTTAAASENSDHNLKDVACIVFGQRSKRGSCSIYLVDLVKKKIKGFFETNGDDYPYRMGYVVYKRMLYMFGGTMLADPEDLVGCNNAYVLDLFEVAKSYGNDKQKPPPLIELPRMTSGKCAPRSVVVGDKICVFDVMLGHRPPHCTFEIFDPKEKTWVRIPDPFLFEQGNFVRGFYVDDAKLFVSFLYGGICELSFGAHSPSWVHHKLFHGVSSLPTSTRGVKIGDIVLTLDVANDLADERGGFAGCVGTTCSGLTAEESYKVDWEVAGPIFRVGPTSVCSVKGVHVHKRSRTKLKVVSDPKCSLGVRKCDSSKEGYKLLVTVYDVDLAARPIQLKVARSFMVPLEIDAQFRAGFFWQCSACDP